jgi:hypothetical protein
LLYVFPARYSRSTDVMIALGWYFLAKLPEVAHLDHGIYHLGHMVRLRCPIVSAASA